MITVLTYVLLLSCATTAVLHAAMFGQSDTPAGSAFASACAGTHISGAGNPGNSVARTYSGTGTCFEAVSAGGTASVNTGLVSGVSPSGQAYTGSAEGSASLGSLKMTGTNSGSAQTSFSGGQATVGWNDQITLGGGTGNSLWVLPILVHGELHAHGLGALSRMQVGVYKNSAALTQGFNSTAFGLFQTLTTERNGTIQYSWDYQMAAFGVSDYDIVHPTSAEFLAIDQTVYFVVPFTYGVSFKLGIWADAHASEIASGGAHVPNVSSFDLGNTITWGGKGYVVDATGNNPTTSFTINSESGFDYNTAVVPEPSTMLMLLAGTGLLLLKRR